MKKAIAILGLAGLVLNGCVSAPIIKDNILQYQKEEKEIIIYDDGSQEMKYKTHIYKKPMFQLLDNKI